MNIVTAQIGGDVSKDEILVSVQGNKPFKTLNQEAALVAAAERLPRPCEVHLERSGGYERLAARVFTQAGIVVRLHNPLKARRLAQAIGPKAKTDAVDAKALAELGELLPVQEPKSAEREALSDLSRAIETIKQTITQYKKRRAVPELDEGAKHAYEKVIVALSKERDELIKQFEKRVRSSSLAADYKLILSVWDVGPVTARNCLCELPENAKRCRPCQVSSYAGLAPIDDSSGKHTGPSRIGRGAVRLKAGMYMSAISALRHQQWAKDLYAGLRAKGRTHQQAIVAVMRRQLLRVVAVLQRNTPWQAEPPTQFQRKILGAP